MTRPAKLFAAILAGAAISSCGREGTPTGPSGPTSFLTGTWRGTVTIQVNPGDPNPPAPMSGDMTWTFEGVPQTNMQSLRATIDASMASSRRWARPPAASSETSSGLCSGIQCR